MNSKIYIILALCLLFFSCSIEKDNKINCKKLTFKNDKFALVDSLDFKFIPLETMDTCLIGFVSDIKIAENKIFVCDIHKSNALFVFDMNGKFITKVGGKGNASNQYIGLFGFDIDKEKRLIVLNDQHRKRLLYYDLDSFQFKYSTNIDFYFSNFQLIRNDNIGFFSYNGFENGVKKYLMITNSTGKILNSFYDCTFSATETLSNTPNRIYTLQDKSYVFHHLFPYIYRIEDNDIVPVYELNFETYKFPDLTFLQENSMNNKRYTSQLEMFDMISSYGIFETSDLICCPYVCKRQYYMGLYNKRSDQGYILSLSDFYKDSRLGVLTDPVGCTEDYLISKVQPQNVMKVKNNSIVSYLSEKVTADDNPIICLLKLK